MHEQYFKSFQPIKVDSDPASIIWQDIEEEDGMMCELDELICNGKKTFVTLLDEGCKRMYYGSSPVFAPQHSEAVFF